MVLQPKVLVKQLSLILGSIFIIFVLTVSTVEGEEPPDKRSELERQLEQLEKEVEGLDVNLQKTKNETRTLAGETKSLETEIKRRELEVKRLALIIRKTSLEVQNKNKNIELLTQKIGRSRKALGAGLFLLYLYDQENTFTVLLKNRSLSDFFGSLVGLANVQSNLQSSLDEFREDRSKLAKEREELEEFEKEQQELKALQEVERRFLAERKKEKDELLRLTKGKETLFQQLLKLKKRDLASLKTQLFYLEKTGVTAEEAIRFADLAAKRVGIRTAFLLALLEVETGKQFEEGTISVGSNIGTGNWRADMSPSERPAFLKITESLNLNPDKMPVSSRPCSKAVRDRIGPGVKCGYGWGGAMGPAQFLPSTWLRFAARVAEITGHSSPNPWNVEDAFTASALFLADAGASTKTVAGETRAAKIYLSGRSNCNTYICRLYSSRILSLARDIDRIL